MQLVFVSVVPSPYQRDVFRAIARRGRVPLRVHYLEETPHDTPWEQPTLESWESILPGRTVVWKRGRSHVNWNLPAPQPGEFWVVNGAMTDVTTQLLMRRLGSRTPWAFWGEVPSAPSSGFKRWLQRRQYAPLRKARFIAAVGRRAVAAYQELVPGVAVHNRPYACDLASFAAVRHAPAHIPETTFLFCGQMIARKGIDLLLEAFGRLVCEGLPVRLLLVGREGELPRLLPALPPAAQARTEYAGFQNPDALPAFFSRADVFVLPSRHDGWGVVVNQAFGAGLPVIVSDAAGAAELIEARVNGLAVAAGRLESLVEAMRAFAADPALRARLADGAVETAKTLGPEQTAAFWEARAQELEPTA